MINKVEFGKYFTKIKRGIKRDCLIGLASLLLTCGNDSPVGPAKPSPPIASQNQSPVIISSPITQVDEKTSYNYNLIATDSNGDYLTYSLIEKPDWLSILGNVISGTAPEVSEDKISHVKWRVSDGKGGTAEQSWDLSVKNVYATHLLGGNLYQQLSQVNENSLVFLSPVSSLNVGDVLVSYSNSKFRNGALREITEISSDKKTIKTKQGSLEKIVTAPLSYQSKIYPRNISQSIKKEGVSEPMFQYDYDFNIKFNDVILYDIYNNPNNPAGKVKLNGEFSFNSSFSLELNTSEHKLTKFTFKHVLDEKSAIKIDASPLLNMIIKEVELASYDCGLIMITIPPGIPIVLQPRIELYAGISGSLDPKGAQVLQQATLTSGVNYENRSWSPISNFTNNFSFYFLGPERNKINYKAYVGAKLNLLLYGIFGPSGKTNAYLQVDAPGSSGWKLYGGLESFVAIESSLLGEYLQDYSAKIIDYKKTLIEQGTEIITTTLQPGPEKVDDAYVTTNYYADGSITYSGYDSHYLNVEKMGSTSHGSIYEALVKMDISSIPANSKISSAKFRLYGQGAFIQKTSTVKIKKILGEWEESKVKGSNKPAYSSSYVASSVLNDDVGWHEWDLTSLVQEWVNGGANHGIAILSDDSRPIEKSGGFYSSDHPDKTKSPQLVISRYK